MLEDFKSKRVADNQVVSDSDLNVENVETTKPVNNNKPEVDLSLKESSGDVLKQDFSSDLDTGVSIDNHVEEPKIEPVQIDFNSKFGDGIKNKYEEWYNIAKSPNGIDVPTLWENDFNANPELASLPDEIKLEIKKEFSDYVVNRIAQDEINSDIYKSIIKGNAEKIFSIRSLYEFDPSISDLERVTGYSQEKASEYMSQMNNLGLNPLGSYQDYLRDPLEYANPYEIAAKVAGGFVANLVGGTIGAFGGLFQLGKEAVSFGLNQLDIDYNPDPYNFLTEISNKIIETANEYTYIPTSDIETDFLTASNVLKGIQSSGTTVGMFIGSTGAVKLGGRLLGTIGSSVFGNSAVARSLAAGGKYVEGFGQFSKFTRSTPIFSQRVAQYNEFLKNYLKTNHTLLSNLSGVGENIVIGTYNRYSESLMEAEQVYRQQLDKYLSMNYSQEKAREMAEEAASVTMTMNMALLPFDIMQTFLVFSKSIPVASAARYNINKFVFNNRKIFNTLEVPTKLLVGSGLEGVEEVFQFYAQELPSIAMDVKAGYLPDEYRGIVERSLRESNELKESFLGGVIGGGMMISGSSIRSAVKGEPHLISQKSKEYLDQYDQMYGDVLRTMLELEKHKATVSADDNLTHLYNKGIIPFVYWASNKLKNKTIDSIFNEFGSPTFDYEKYKAEFGENALSEEYIKKYGPELKEVWNRAKQVWEEMPASEKKSIHHGYELFARRFFANEYETKANEINDSEILSKRASEVKEEVVDTLAERITKAKIGEKTDDNTEEYNKFKDKVKSAIEANPKLSEAIEKGIYSNTLGNVINLSQRLSEDDKVNEGFRKYLDEGVTAFENEGDFLNAYLNEFYSELTDTVNNIDKNKKEVSKDFVGNVFSSNKLFLDRENFDKFKKKKLYELQAKYHKDLYNDLSKRFENDDKVKEEANRLFYSIKSKWEANDRRYKLAHFAGMEGVLVEDINEGIKRMFFAPLLKYKNEIGEEGVRKMGPNYRDFIMITEKNANLLEIETTEQTDLRVAKEQTNVLKSIIDSIIKSETKKIKEVEEELDRLRKDIKTIPEEVEGNEEFLAEMISELEDKKNKINELNKSIEKLSEYRSLVDRVGFTETLKHIEEAYGFSREVEALLVRRISTDSRLIDFLDNNIYQKTRDLKQTRKIFKEIVEEHKKKSNKTEIPNETILRVLEKNGIDVSKINPEDLTDDTAMFKFLKQLFLRINSGIKFTDKVFKNILNDAAENLKSELDDLRRLRGAYRAERILLNNINKRFVEIFESKYVLFKTDRDTQSKYDSDLYEGLMDRSIKDKRFTGDLFKYLARRESIFSTTGIQDTVRESNKEEKARYRALSRYDGFRNENGYYVLFVTKDSSDDLSKSLYDKYVSKEEKEFEEKNDYTGIHAFIMRGDRPVFVDLDGRFKLDENYKSVENERYYIPLKFYLMKNLSEERLSGKEYNRIKSTYKLNTSAEILAKAQEELDKYREDIINEIKSGKAVGSEINRVSQGIINYQEDENGNIKFTSLKKLGIKRSDIAEIHVVKNGSIKKVTSEEKVKLDSMFNGSIVMELNNGKLVPLITRNLNDSEVEGVVEALAQALEDFKISKVKVLKEGKETDSKMELEPFSNSKNLYGLMNNIIFYGKPKSKRNLDKAIYYQSGYLYFGDKSIPYDQIRSSQELREFLKNKRFNFRTFFNSEQSKINFLPVIKGVKEKIEDGKKVRYVTIYSYNTKEKEGEQSKDYIDVLLNHDVFKAPLSIDAGDRFLNRGLILDKSTKSFTELRNESQLKLNEIKKKAEEKKTAKSKKKEGKEEAGEEKKSEGSTTEQKTSGTTEESDEVKILNVNEGKKKVLKSLGETEDSLRNKLKKLLDYYKSDENYRNTVNKDIELVKSRNISLSSVDIDNIPVHFLRYKEIGDEGGYIEFMGDEYFVSKRNQLPFVFAYNFLLKNLDKFDNAKEMFVIPQYMSVNTYISTILYLAKYDVYENNGKKITLKDYGLSDEDIKSLKEMSIPISDKIDPFVNGVYKFNIDSYIDFTKKVLDKKGSIDDNTYTLISLFLDKMTDAFKAILESKGIDFEDHVLKNREKIFNVNDRIVTNNFIGSLILLTHSKDLIKESELEETGGQAEEQEAEEQPSENKPLSDNKLVSSTEKNVIDDLDDFINPDIVDNNNNKYIDEITSLIKEIVDIENSGDLTNDETLSFRGDIHKKVAEAIVKSGNYNKILKSDLSNNMTVFGFKLDKNKFIDKLNEVVNMSIDIISNEILDFINENPNIMNKFGNEYQDILNNSQNKLEDLQKLKEKICNSFGGKKSSLGYTETKTGNNWSIVHDFQGNPKHNEGDIVYKSKKLEGGEIVIKNENGDEAIIPSSKRNLLLKFMASGNNRAITKMVNKLRKSEI